MNTKKNLVSALIYQFAVILSGLILPRLIIGTFGSDVNGLVSSMTQFLGFTSLLEGGLGAVVLAELYLPIENRDNKLIDSILSSCRNFFRRISVFFVIFTFILMLLFPVLIANGFDFYYTSSLLFIISINTLCQYLFSITYKLLLQADQKVYICNITSTITILVNLILTIIIIIIFPSIHLVKLGSSVAFLIQPIIYEHYVKKYYKIKLNCNDEYKLENRWSGFSQNLAHFINMNTDIILLSIFVSFKEVSVYSVYMLALNALRQIISAISNSYQSNLGKYNALDNRIKVLQMFQKFESSLWFLSTILFCTCLLLINPFVKLYTLNVSDANYYRPIFAIIMTIAQFIYCGRESYRLLILSGGKFKETNFGSIMEAIINLVISVILVCFIGIEGVAIGTFVAIAYRLVYFLCYLKNNLININIINTSKLLLISLIMFIVNIGIYYLFTINITNFISFIFYGMVITLLEFLLLLIIKYVVFYMYNFLMKSRYGN